MTSAALATCRRFSAALAALDCDAALADAHPEIELHTPREMLHGAAGLRTLLAPPALEYLEPSVSSPPVNHQPEGKPPCPRA